MTPQAIAKLRRTFIAIAMVSFFVVIAFVGVTTIVSNVLAVRAQASQTIDAIIDAGGQTPQEENFHAGEFHEEASYGYRFFAVFYDDEGNVVDVNLTNIRSIDYEDAVNAALIASDPSTLTGLGQEGNFFYKEGSVDGGSVLVFLDCSIILSNMWNVIVNTIFFCFIAMLVTFALIVFFSKRAVQTEVQNARRQQEFMTNAGHELKTPIAVIRANTELTEMISGETEWTQSTLRQVDRLDGLVKNLMAIARGEEQAYGDGEIAIVDVTETVTNAVESFKGLASQQGLELKSEVAGDVKLRGFQPTIEQLTCLLVDNAIKYCDDGGCVKVVLSNALLGKGCNLVVSNNFFDGADVNYRRFFERFYREDEAHENQQGYGIGLSVAESICNRYHGTIKANWKNGVISFTCVLKGL